MNKQCEIVQDLLPLYVDGACSESSAEMVREHLESCTECDKICHKMASHTNEDILKEESKSVVKRHKMKEKKKNRRNIILAVLISIALVFLVVVSLWSPAIFQRGNPIPYLIAATKISNENPYIQVDVDSVGTIYISKRGDCPALFEYVEDSRNVEFVEQAGSGYIFSNGIDNLVISSEIYWGQYTVWYVPDNTLATN